MENTIKDLLDQGLKLMSQENMKDLVEAGLKVFKSPFAGQEVAVDVNNDFSDWLLHDYWHEGKTLYDIAGHEEEAVDIIKASFLSIFKVTEDKDKLVFKDIFTNKDFVVTTTEVCNTGDLIKARLYPIGGHHHLLQEPIFYDPAYEVTIRKSVMFQYNNYCVINGPTEVDRFIQDQSLMIYHLSSLIDYYEGVLEDDESLYVYVAKYKVVDKDLLLDCLLDQGDFHLIEHNEFETLIHHMVEDHILAEILVDDQWMEVECVKQTDLGLTKDCLKLVIEDHAKYVSEACLGMDDLLN